MNEEQIKKLKKGDLIIDTKTNQLYRYDGDCNKRFYAFHDFNDIKKEYAKHLSLDDSRFQPLDDYYKVGDTVKIRSEYHYGCTFSDYRCGGFGICDGFRNIGGNIYRIKEKRGSEFVLDCNIIGETYTWSPEMFECKVEQAHIDIVKPLSIVRPSRICKIEAYSGVSEEEKMDLDSIKKKNLVEARRQYEEQRKNAEIEFALKKYKEAQGTIDEIDREINKLMERRKSYKGIVAKYRDAGKKKNR